MKSFVFFLLGSIFGIAVILGADYIKDLSIIRPLEKKIDEVVEKPLEKYTFESLKKHQFAKSKIAIVKKLKDEEDFASYLFYFNIDPKYGTIVKDGKKVPLRVSGMMNVPKDQETKHPVILMFRGFVDQSIFTTGEGTRRSAGELASNGFITLAPDFLGYGESDNPSINPIEERFQTYITALSLFSSLESLPSALQTYSDDKGVEQKGVQPPDAGVVPLQSIQPNLSKIGVWGHSNGGHIALAAIAISGNTYPTVLWNPVSKPFPYSILYFTDEYDDQGKALRVVVANFERDYDIFLYSPERYYKWLKAPIQLHQSLSDEAVPPVWSDQLEATLKEKKIEVEYFKYPGENHNFNLGSWSTAISRTINFYSSNFNK